MRFKYAEVPRYRGITLETDSVVRKTWIVTEEEYALEVGKLVNHLIRNPNPKVVPVYDWQYFGRAEHGYKYSYSMMRMGVISRHEKQIIDTAGDHRKAFIESPHNTCVADQCEGLASEWPQLVAFLLEVIKEDRYLDLHSGNIMMDLDENYRLIDLEGFISFNFKGGHNSWFQD